VPLVFVAAYITAITVPMLFDRVLDISLSAGGIAIGLIIYFYQNKQGKEIHSQGEEIHRQGAIIVTQGNEIRNVVARVNEQSERIREQSEDITNVVKGVRERSEDIKQAVDQVNEQSKEIGNTLSKVNMQTEKLEALLKDVRAVNDQVHARLMEAKKREDDRKRFILYQAHADAAEIEEVAIKTVKDIEERFARKDPAPPDEEYERTRKYFEESTMEYLKERFNKVQAHFNEVKDLMNSPRVSLDVVNAIWSTLYSLGWLVREASPRYDRGIFLQSLSEIKDR
jgi:chromosome segregation ATPase